MGILKGCAKLVGSVALGATGVASAVLRACASGAGMDELADAIGTLQDKSFNTIQDMWTPEEEKTEEYYENQAQKCMDRAETAARIGAEKREEYERLKSKMNNE